MDTVAEFQLRRMETWRRVRISLAIMTGGLLYLALGCGNDTLPALCMVTAAAVGIAIVHATFTWARFYRCPACEERVRDSEGGVPLNPRACSNCGARLSWFPNKLAMNDRPTILLGITIAVLLTSARVAADEHERRAKVPSQRAQSIAGELFPEKCGSNGILCGITYGANYCPLQFVINFPATKETAASEPSGAWVTVDQRGNVVEVSSKRAKDCRNGIAS